MVKGVFLRARACSPYRGKGRRPLEKPGPGRAGFSQLGGRDVVSGQAGDRPPPNRREQAEAFQRMTPDSRRYWNVISTIRRRERRLINSMAHTPRPRPADLERWRGMEAELAELRALAASLRPDRHGPKTGGDHARA